MKVESYEQLIVWQKSMDFVVEVYEVTERFPKGELYGLTSQMRRAAVSIPSNIAEGSRRGSKKDFKNFLRIAYGSGAELETQTGLAVRLAFVSADDCARATELLDEIMRMLNVFIRNLDS
jgi:four helix bundle protein